MSKTIHKRGTHPTEPYNKALLKKTAAKNRELVLKAIKDGVDMGGRPPATKKEKQAAKLYKEGLAN